MNGNLILESVLIGSLFFVPILVDGAIIENTKFGYWMEYPTNWIADETVIELEPLPGVNSGSRILVKITDGLYWWNHFISVSMTDNDYFVVNFLDLDYLDQIKNTLEEACTIATLDVEGYVCSNYSLIDAKILELNGNKAYQIKESWIETYHDNTTKEKIGILTDIIVDDDVWTIHSINNAQNYSNSSEVIDEIINSFQFIPVSEIQEPLAEKEIPWDMILPPLKQLKAGTHLENIECKPNLVLMIKYNGNPACVNQIGAEKLESRGWGTRTL